MFFGFFATCRNGQFSPFLHPREELKNRHFFVCKFMHDRLLLLSSICSSFIQDYEPFLIAVFYYFLTLAVDYLLVDCQHHAKGK